MKSDWERDKQVARAILADRQTRRKWMARCLMLVLFFLVLGLWVIDEWLAQHALFFALWWVSCALLTLSLMLFAMFDALMVIREERSRR